VRRSHFEALHPICPLCRAALAIGTVIRESDDDVLEGILLCGGCRREFPIVDGIPVIVGPIRTWLAANPLQLLMRDDLSPELESLVGDVLGPGSPYDLLRQHTGMYADDHYRAGSAASVIEDIDAGNGGPLLDIGCATGGTTFQLARKSGAMTLGIDLNFAMLRVASRVLREGRVRYARRRIGVVYDRRDEMIEMPARELVDFWCCDAGALPFADAIAATAASVNVIDCNTSPQQSIAELARVVRPGGLAIISTPYDWSPSATPYENWIGGHSQRGPHAGAAEPLLRDLIAEHFTIEREETDVPWRVRLHDRSAVDYRVHLFVAKRRNIS
jgi:SAM-dependent methyltransferase/uncharacterized protein YbaR (Trm112 family)